MLRTMCRYLMRGLYSLGILVTGSLWLLASIGYIAGWQLSSPPLQQLSIMLILFLTGVHFVLNIWPMQWLNHAIDRVLERYFPLPEISLTAQDAANIQRKHAWWMRLKARLGWN